jgi:hypothetical protein
MDAAGTCPVAIRQGEIGVDQSAGAAGFGGGEEPAYGDQVGIVPIGFIGKHRSELAPTGIKHALGQLGFRKSANVQIFNRNEVELASEIGAQLVQKVIALVAGLLVQTRDSNPRLATIAAALHLPTERLLRPPQLARLGAIPARVVDCFTRRQHGKRFQAQIDTDVRAGRSVGFRRDLLLSHQTDIPVSAGFALERCAFGDTVGWSMNDCSDQPDLGNRDERTVEPHILRHPKARRVGLLGLELRETFLFLAMPRAAKEVLIRAIEITKRLLQQLTVDLAQPCRCGLLFNPGEFGRKIVVRKRRASLLKVFALAIQAPIPNDRREDAN